MKTTGQIIREARLRAGLTQRELGDRIDAAQTYISRLEKGDKGTVESLRRVAKGLGMQLIIKFE